MSLLDDKVRDYLTQFSGENKEIDDNHLFQLWDYLLTDLDMSTHEVAEYISSREFEQIKAELDLEELLGIRESF